MNRSIYWGAGLFILLIGVGSFVFYSQYSELQQLKQDAAEADELLEEKNKPIADNDPPAAREGFKMVPHDDHFHEVPIDAPDTWQGEPVVADGEVPQTPPHQTEGVYKKGINGQQLYYPPHPPLETYAHLLKDPMATLRKNAKIIVENYGTPAADAAWSELGLLRLAIHKGQVGGSMWSDESLEINRLKEEVLWKPLEEMGIVASVPVPIVEPISKGGTPK